MNKDTQHLVTRTMEHTKRHNSHLRDNLPYLEHLGMERALRSWEREKWALWDTGTGRKYHVDTHTHTHTHTLRAKNAGMDGAVTLPLKGT